MLKFAIIAAGGALGAVLRYLISGGVSRFAEGIFPWGTFAVNVSGAFVIGLFWEFFEENFFVSNDMRLFLFIGILGAYTTFSTYSLESLNLIRDGEFLPALLNIFLNNVFCIAFVFAGIVVSRLIIYGFK